MEKSRHIIETEQRLEEAASWAALLQDADATETDWENFTLWLEASEENRKAYDQMEDLGLLIDEQNSELAAMVEQPAAQKGLVVSLVKWRQSANMNSRAVGSAIAAMAAMLFIAVSFIGNEPAPESFAFATGVGEWREVMLADGSSVHLNVNTALEVTLSSDARRTRLIRGEALFDVAPDTGKPFYVSVADRQIRVVGTVFNVLHHEGAVTVTVAEGIVEVAPAGMDVGGGNQRAALQNTGKNNTEKAVTRLTVGKQLYHKAGDASSTTSLVDVSDVAAWQDGFLAYEARPLSEVVKDLNRYFEKQVKLRNGADKLLFSGVLDMSDQAAILRLLADILPVEIMETGQEIVIRQTQ